MSPDLEKAAWSCCNLQLVDDYREWKRIREYSAEFERQKFEEWQSRQP
jgi:hypothetical protein